MLAAAPLSSDRVRLPLEEPRLAKKQRVRRVTWAPDDRLCQVRLFASGDAPRQGAQRQVQLRAQLQAHDAKGGDKAPVLARQVDAIDRAAIERMVAQVRWYAPEQVKIEAEWGVGAGDESSERDLQKRREATAFEAFYPRASSIPTSPMEDPAMTAENIPKEALAELEKSIPQIPLVPVEEDETEEPSGQLSKTQPPSISATPSEAPKSWPPAPVAPPNNSMAVQAAVVAATVANKSNIDQKLLMEILQNPSLLKQSGSALAANKPAVVAPQPSMPVVPPPIRMPEPGLPAMQPHLQEGRPGAVLSIPWPVGHVAPHRPAGILAGWTPQHEVGRTELAVSSSAPLHAPVHHQSPGIGPPIRAEGVQPPLPPGPPPWALHRPPLDMHQPRQQPGEWLRPPSMAFPPPQLHHVQRPQHDHTRLPEPPMLQHQSFQNQMIHDQQSGPRPAGGGKKQGKKMCGYFNTPKGCWKGESCTFAHIPDRGNSHAQQNGSILSSNPRPEVLVSR